MALIAGVIGCGNISRFHFSGLEKANVDVRWICDIAEDVAKPWVDKFGAFYTTNYKDIISDPKVDFVVITAPSSVHKEICIDAIEQGKAVICEKTLAENADDSLEIVSLAEEKQIPFYTCYMKRFIPAFEKAKELLPSLGRILSTHIRGYQPWGANLWDGNPADGFFHTPVGEASMLVKNYGGGILTCGGSHMLDLVLFFLGRPQRVFSLMNIPDERDYDLQTTAIMETNNGFVQFEVMAHQLGKTGFLHDGFDEQVEIIGTMGKINVFSAMWDQCDTKATYLVHYDESTQQSVEYHFDPISPFEIAIKSFCENIENNNQGQQSCLTGYEVDELIDHILKSTALGKIVDVEWRI